MSLKSLFAAMFIVVCLFLFFALFIASIGSAHILAKQNEGCHTLTCQLKYQKYNLSHVLYVAKRGSGEPARWHRPWVPILRKEIARTQSKLAASRVSSVYEIARSEAARLGVTGSAWSCLSALITRENGNPPSSWNPKKWNSQGSTAYGLPQALPGSKMSSSGSDWAWNPATQVRWMVDYVKKYGGACGANYFQMSNNWY